MRTVTPQEQSTLYTRTYVTHLRVWVRRPDSTQVDLSALLGQDWLMGATWNESVETPVAQATVSARRNGPGGAVQSLSPMVGSSLANRTGAGVFSALLQEGREFRIEVASLPPGRAPASGDWREVFFGRVDNVDAGPEELRFDGRDYFGGHAQDTFIEAEADYGNDTVGVAAQTVMAQIGTAAGLNGFLVANLWTPVDPLWQLGRYTQKRVPVYEAWQQLAGQLGWEVRQVWRPGVGFVPSLRSPERLASAAVWTFGPDDYLELPVVRRALLEIRNVVEVVYSDYADRDATNLPKRKRVTATNPSSVTDYGRRYMQVAEASNSNVNTTAEAQRLADAAIADLSDSPLEVEVPLRASFWPVEVGDLITLQPDGVSLDTEQTLAVTSIDHAFTSDGFEKTTLKLRGRPAISRDTWMSRDAAPGVAPLSKLTGPDAPSAVTATGTINGAVVSFTPAPSGPAWDSYELHVSTTTGFAPSSATLKAAQATTRFEVADLPPGVTHYAVVRGRTVEGNVGTASAQVTLAPRYVEPRFAAPTTSWGTAPLNYDFEAQGVPTAPPDNWTMTSGAWGTDAVLTSDALSGSRALQFQTGNSAIIVSQAISVRPGLRYSIDVFAKGSSGALLTTSLQWLDAAGVVVDFSDAFTTFDGGTWRRVTNAKAAPTTARYVRAKLESLLGGAGRTIQVDSVQIDLAETVQEAGALLTYFGDWDDYTLNGRSGVRAYKDSTGRVQVEGNVAGGIVGTSAVGLPVGYRPPVTRDFLTPSQSGPAWVTVGADGAITVLTGSSVWTSLSGISFRAA